MLHIHAEAPGSRRPTLLDWALVTPLLLLAAALAVGFIVVGLLRGAAR